jgi:MFS family permease
MVAAVVGLAAVPFWSHLSDKVGRRPIYLSGAVVSLLVTFPSFWLIQQGPGFVGPAIVLAMVGHDMMYGPMAAYLSELFGTRVRYSGASLVYQFTALFAGGLAPLIATLLMARSGFTAVASYVAACCTVTVVAAWFAPETHRVSLDDRGHLSG